MYVHHGRGAYAASSVCLGGRRCVQQLNTNERAFAEWGEWKIGRESVVSDRSERRTRNEIMIGTISSVDVKDVAVTLCPRRRIHGKLIVVYVRSPARCPLDSIAGE
ncbi:hypothetical protein EVAR_8184_1 [Eumeta japonica]|uniref:Uncharacterized protein n=1 Tax=Eumeta variegata TaxID=151549 RepID=A0A4C1TGB1_EUMVA|nr:hypothetical protein EVAR_8184_1 [Eumeta japonica]